MPRRTLPLLLPLLLTACTSTTSSSTANPTFDSSHDTTRLVGVPMRATSEFTIPLPPLEAAPRIAEIFTALRFTVQIGQLERFGLHQAQKNDYFYAATAAIGANDVRLLTIARWTAENQTTITFTSDLTDPQHAHVTSLLQQALGVTTTQPSSR